MDKCYTLKLENMETGETVGTSLDESEIGEGWKIGDVVTINSDSDQWSLDRPGEGAHGIRGEFKILGAQGMELVNLDDEEIDTEG